VAKKSKRHATKAIVAQKKGRTKKRRPRRRLTAAQKKAIINQIRASFETTRKEEEEDTRERVLSLLRAVLRVKEFERCDFWFLPFVCVRVCVS
jgi:hypothetical protein